MTEADPLEVAAWRMAAGDLLSEDLPEIATEALVRGLDSPALRVLAGQSRGDVRDSADLFRAALNELGIDLPDTDSAQWHLARRTAAEIAAGRISPARGANELLLAYFKVRDSGDLRIFVGLASMLDDHPEDAEHIEAEMVTAAQELLARPAPRRWIKLMAARGRSPLTQTAGPDQIEVDPDALQISDRLRYDLARWDAHFAAVLSDWPAAGGFDSEHDAERFVAAGRQLVSQLQDELGAGYHVEYMPEPIRPPRVKLRRPRYRKSNRPGIVVTALIAAEECVLETGRYDGPVPSTPEPDAGSQSRRFQISAAAWMVTTSVVLAGWAAIYLLFRGFNHEANAAIGYSRDFGDPLTGGSSSLFGGRPTLFEIASLLGPPIVWAVAVVSVARLRVRSARASRRAE